ncbi:MAG: hypothetical protein IJ486_09835 [Firmicutes bacterium]|nr:hypothetical protein [Bacillota bacterium]
MSRNIRIKRGTGYGKYGNIVMDVATGTGWTAKHYKLHPKMTIDIPLDEKSYTLIFTYVGVLKAEAFKLDVPAGSNNYEVEVWIAKDNKINIRQITNQMPSGGGVVSGGGNASRIGGNTLPGGLSDEKLRKELNKLLDPVNGKVYKSLKTAGPFGTFARIQVGSSALSFNARIGMNMETIHTLFFSSIKAQTNPSVVEDRVVLNSAEDRDTIVRFIHKYVNSSNCPGVYMEGYDILLQEGYVHQSGASGGGTKVSGGVNSGVAMPKVDPVPKKPAVDVWGSSTTELIRDAVKDHLHFVKGYADGKLFKFLFNVEPDLDYILVNVGTRGIAFNGHKRFGMPTDTISCATINFKDINASKPGQKKTFDSLDSKEEREELLRVIQQLVNSDECPVAHMEENRIIMDQDKVLTKDHPDMNYSVTSWGLWCKLIDYFGEDTEFAENIKKMPCTCFVTVGERNLRVTLMVEDEKWIAESEDGGTQIIDFYFAETTSEYLKWRQSQGVEIRFYDWQNRFYQLDHEEDKAELVDYLMFLMEGIPHVIVEGNSFRSRRPGEELIDIEHSLTAKVISQKIVQLFDLNGKYVDILRKKNVAYIQITGYKEYLKLLVVDKDDECIDNFQYDYIDLAGAEYTTGENCFARLTCGNETDRLEWYIGEQLCNIPHFKAKLLNNGEPFYSNICLDKSIVPGLDEDYIPEPEAPEEPEISETPEEPVVPEVPEVPEVPDEPEIPEITDESEIPVIPGEDDLPPFYEIIEEPEVAEIPEVPEVSEVPVEPVESVEQEEQDELDEPEDVVYNVYSSPTTWAIVAALNVQFAAGGGLQRYMKDCAFDHAELSVESEGVSIQFWKKNASTSKLTMNFSQFDTGAAGHYQILSDQDQALLESILKSAVPFFGA